MQSLTLVLIFELILLILFYSVRGEDFIIETEDNHHKEEKIRYSQNYAVYLWHKRAGVSHALENGLGQYRRRFGCFVFTASLGTHRVYLSAPHHTTLFSLTGITLFRIFFPDPWPERTTQRTLQATIMKFVLTHKTFLRRMYLH